MAIRLTFAAADAAVNGTGLRSYIDVNPVLKFYVGSVPPEAENDPVGTLLGDVAIASFGPASNGVITSAGGSDTADDSGTVGCFALFQDDGSTKVLDGTAGEASASDIIFDEEDFVSGGTISVGSFTITVPPH